MPQPQVVAITGSSGVGKSTLAKALQEELLPQQWLHFSVDSVFYCLPKSIIHQVDLHNNHSAIDSTAIVGSAYACARTLLDEGHQVIFDAVILSDKGANDLRRAFEAYQCVFVELTCSWEEIARRTLERNDRTLAEAEHGFRNASGHLDVHHTLDTSRSTPEQLAKELVTFMRVNTL